MFVEVNELYTAIQQHTMGYITAEPGDAAKAINAAVKEMTSYLNSRYDCPAIFGATGDDRDALVLEHCKSIAVWYIIRQSNADIIFEKAKIYYDNAKEWLKLVSGVDKEGKPIAADLPLKKDSDGRVKTQIRMGSNRKFRHNFDD